MVKGIWKYVHLCLAVKPTGRTIDTAEVTSRQWWRNLSAPESYLKITTDQLFFNEEEAWQQVKK